MVFFMQHCSLFNTASSAATQDSTASPDVRFEPRTLVVLLFLFFLNRGSLNKKIKHEFSKKIYGPGFDDPDGVGEAEGEYTGLGVMQYGR
jgi:hypothetical protein